MTAYGSSAFAESRTIFRLLARIAFPHRDDAPLLSVRRPNHHPPCAGSKVIHTQLCTPKMLPGQGLCTRLVSAKYRRDRAPRQGRALQLRAALTTYWKVKQGAGGKRWRRDGR